MEIGAAYDSEGEPIPEDIIREASCRALTAVRAGDPW